MKKVKDNFSEQSALYLKFRPKYPEELIDYISGYAPERNLAWDCATGNGQVALLLSEKFKKVIATDISQEQINKAPQKANITYKIERGESSSLETNSVDLIMVAQAIHWFDFDAFYKEVKRVLKKNGVIAFVGYPLFSTENLQLDALILHFYQDIVGPYWDAERKHIDKRYASIPFPFKEISLPKLQMKYNWTSQQILGYLESWSAVAHFQRKNGTNPVSLIKAALEKIVSKRNKVEVRFEIIGRIGSDT